MMRVRRKRMKMKLLVTVLDLKANGELFHSCSIFSCIKDVIFVTENPDAGYIYTLSHLLLL